MYADNGAYEVRITVTDDDGAQAFDTFTSFVTNADPTVEVGSDMTVDDGERVFLGGGLIGADDRRLPAVRRRMVHRPGSADVHKGVVDWATARSRNS